MPLPVPSPSRLPRQSVQPPPASTAPPARKQKILPTTAGTEPRMFSSGKIRLSPPRSPGIQNSGEPQAEFDATRMPPPPQPTGSGRTMSLRSIASNSSARSKKSDEPKKSGVKGGLGKMLSLRRDSKTGSSEGKKGEESTSRLGRAMSMSFRSSKQDSEKGKGGEPSKGLLGRTMSLRSTKSLIGGGSSKTESTSASSSLAPSSLAPNGPAKAGRMRPVSMYNPPIVVKLEPAPAPSTSSVGRRPTTSATAIPAAKSHRRSASTISTNSTNSVTAPSSSKDSHPTSGSKSKRPPFTGFTQEFAAAPVNVPASPRSRVPVFPPPPLDTATVHAQTQLLQLITLHSSSGAAYQDLIASATATLKSRFEQLSARHYDVRETSIKKHNRQNLTSLATVATSASPAELVQAFSEGMKRTDALRTGEFRRLAAAFGEWIRGYPTHADRWVDGIGDAWKQECTSVERRLHTAVAGIAGVHALFADDDVVKTTVQRVAEGYSALASGMLEELELMRRMEGEVVAKERRVLKEKVDNITTSAATHVPVWSR